LKLKFKKVNIEYIALIKFIFLQLIQSTMHVTLKSYPPSAVDRQVAWL